MKTFIISCTVLLLAVTTVFCEDKDGGPTYKVIVPADNKVESISKQELVAVFMGRQKLTDDKSTRITPVLIDKESPVMVAFIKEVLGQSVDEYAEHWRQRLFSGRGAPPRELDTSEEVVALVKHTRGAIGIVEASTETEGVRLVPIR